MNLVVGLHEYSNFGYAPNGIGEELISEFACNNIEYTFDARPLYADQNKIGCNFGMYSNGIRCQLSSGLQGKPFGREGVFEYGHLYDSQHYVIYLLCMTCMTYDCVHIHNHTDIDLVHTFICVSACMYIEYEQHALCNNFGSSAIALEDFMHLYFF